jgi:hypothetical protein
MSESNIKDGVMHLSVNADGLVSLWDSELQAQLSGERYVALQLDGRQEGQLFPREVEVQLTADATLVLDDDGEWVLWLQPDGEGIDPRDSCNSFIAGSFRSRDEALATIRRTQRVMALNMKEAAR